MPSNQTPHPYKGIITGATGGLGQAMAMALGPQCSHMLLMGRQSTALCNLQKNLQQAHPHLQVDTLQGDLSQTSTLQTMQKWAQHHNCNLWIANAGINCFGPVEHTPVATQQAIVHTNLTATLEQSQMLLPTLLAQPSAQIVLVGSMLGYIGYPGNAAYCASKFGLRGYAQALHRELAHTSVQVKYFAPRAVDTAINHGPVRAMQQAMGIQPDSPQLVAQHLLACLNSKKSEYKIGFPERFYAFLNQLCPWLTNQAIAKQLPIIQQHYPTHPNSGEQP